MERNYTKTNTIYYRGTFKFGRTTSPLLYTSSLRNSLYLFPHRYYSDSSNLLSSKLSEEEKKTEKLDRKMLKTDILRKGFPVVFPDMSKIRQKNYRPICKPGSKITHFISLKKVPGIYMITNKQTKKYYIGMSTNLYIRLYNYLDVKRLELNGSSRINKALLKYGFENFSITILELPNTSNTSNEKTHGSNSISSELKGYGNIYNYLRKREDFFIKVLKPQYNSKIYIATRELDFVKHKCKINMVIPLKVKNLLDKCLDPKQLDYNLRTFKFSKLDKSYQFVAITPKFAVRANSKGWFEGKITKSLGFESSTFEKEMHIQTFLRLAIDWQICVDKQKLAEFYTGEGQGIKYVKDCLKSKLKALKIEWKKKENESR